MLDAIRSVHSNPRVTVELLAAALFLLPPEVMALVADKIAEMTVTAMAQEGEAHENQG
jgi:hypothetical protein